MKSIMKIGLTGISLFAIYFIKYTYDYVEQDYKFIVAFVGGILFVKFSGLLKFTGKLLS